MPYMVARGAGPGPGKGPYYMIDQAEQRRAAHGAAAAENWAQGRIAPFAGLLDWLPREFLSLYGAGIVGANLLDTQKLPGPAPIFSYTYYPKGPPGDAAHAGMGGYYVVPES
jgi:hypothetical protein